jgi:phage antirepressor YoqD-like protein
MDTPAHIRQKQLRIWLSKSPAERLRQFLIDNGALIDFWKEAQKNLTPAKKKDN